MPPTIPTIDLSLPRPTVVNLIRTACLTHGFFQITSYQLPHLIQETLFDYAKRFFALPNSEKLRFTRANYMVSGYEAFQTYSLQASRGKPDLNECFSTTSIVYDEDSGWPVETEENGLIGFKQCCRTYHPAMEELSKMVAGYIAEGLGLDKAYFDEYFFKPSTSFRLIHYFAGDSEEGDNIDDGEERIGAGLHSDWSLMTILWQDNVGGLQVFDPDSDSFIPVRPVPNALVVNVGDLLSRFTNGVYPSPEHRVLAPPPGSHRFSIPFFCHGNPDYLVDVLPLSQDWKEWVQNSGKSKEVGSAVRKWEPITSGAYLEMKFELSKAGRKEEATTA